MSELRTAQFARILSLLLLVLAISCEVGVSFDEVARVRNPSGAVDAVLFEVNGGATTSYGYRVFIVPAGKIVSSQDVAVARFYGAVRNESAYGVDLKWSATNQLVCEYLRARNSELLKETFTVRDSQFAVSLRSNITNNAAPAGGMLDNLSSHRR